MNRREKIDALVDAINGADPVRAAMVKLQCEIGETFPDLVKDSGTMQFRWVQLINAALAHPAPGSRRLALAVYISGEAERDRMIYDANTNKAVEKWHARCEADALPVREAFALDTADRNNRSTARTMPVKDIAEMVSHSETARRYPLRVFKVRGEDRSVNAIGIFEPFTMEQAARTQSNPPRPLRAVCRQSGACPHYVLRRWRSGDGMSIQPLAPVVTRTFAELAAIDSAFAPLPIVPRTIEEGRAWMTALHAAGLMFHFDDSPEDLAYFAHDRANGSHVWGAPLFAPGDIPHLRACLDALYSFDWAPLGCPIGFALVLDGHWDAEGFSADDRAEMAA